MGESRAIVDCPLNKSTSDGGRHQPSPPKCGYDCECLLPKYSHLVYPSPTKANQLITVWTVQGELKPLTKNQLPISLASALKAKYSRFKLFPWWFITIVLFLCHLPPGYLTCLFQVDFELLESRVHSAPSISCPAPWGHQAFRKRCFLQDCSSWTLSHTAFFTATLQRVKIEESQPHQFLLLPTK